MPDAEPPPAEGPVPETATSAFPAPTPTVQRLRRALESRRVTPALLVAVAASALYVVILGGLALRKYATFHATFEDLGIENQALWLLSHGGLSAYYSSGFNQIYPVQYQKPILFLVVPFYSLYPHPETLIVLGNLALGAGAVPLFLLARRMLRGEVYPLLLVAAYLLYFPLASASLFDFHYEDLFPFLFLTMAWLWASGRPRGMYIAAALTAGVNPLTLLTVIAFLVFTALPPPKRRLGLSWVLGGLRSLLQDPYRVVAILALVVIFTVYGVVGVLYTAGTGPHGAAATPTQILYGYANQKLLLLVLLLGSLAFLPFYSIRGLVTALPYAGFALYSLNNANFAAFGLMYPLLGTGPLFLATVDGLRAASTRPAIAADEPLPLTGVWNRRPTRSRTTSERGAMVRALVISTAMFALVFFPFSPVNTYVTGGYFSGAHDVANITSSNSATAFLQRVIDLVPANASVLTQNNLPQLSGRWHVQIAPAYLPTVPYDAIVMDANVNYFSSVTSLIPFVQDAFNGSRFGIVAEGEGALFLSEGYQGAPRLFEPVNVTLPPSELTPFGGLTVRNGTISGSGPAYSLWYGPFLTLYPGRYTAIFDLSSNTTGSTASAITIDVTSANGAHLLAGATLSPSNFTAADTSTQFSLSFNLTGLTTSVELRGMFPTGVAQITLEGIHLQQLSYLP